jgi:hypothetical protein
MSPTSADFAVFVENADANAANSSAGVTLGRGSHIAPGEVARADVPQYPSVRQKGNQTGGQNRNVNQNRKRRAGRDVGLSL